MKCLRLSLLLITISVFYAHMKNTTDSFLHKGGGSSVYITTQKDRRLKHSVSTRKLHQAVLNKDAMAIESLVSRGANINAPNENGDRPIDIAYTQGDFYLVALLKKYGANIQKERIGKLPPEFKVPHISETFFEKSKLKEECIAMLKDTQKAFDLFKQTQQFPEYYNRDSRSSSFYLNFEHATVQEKYPLVYLLLRKQVNALLAYKPMRESIKLGIIFSSTEKNLFYNNAHAERETNTIRFGWAYIYNYITYVYAPYTIYSTLAHEWQHLYQLKYRTEADAIAPTISIETEVDADFLSFKISLLHIDDTARHDFIKQRLTLLIYTYLSSKIAYSAPILITLSHHIQKAITNLDPLFLNNNFNFIGTSLKNLIEKAHAYTSQNKSPREYARYMIQFILDNYHDEIQKPYIQEQQDFTSSHPSDKARNENALKVACLYEISLLKKYYGSQANVIISPQNAPHLHALATKDLATAAIADKPKNQSINVPLQKKSKNIEKTTKRTQRKLAPYRDFVYTIQLNNYVAAQPIIPFVSKKNNIHTLHTARDQELFSITFPESFFIFALCNPQPHKVFSSTIIDARKKTNSLSSDNQQKKIYPFNKNTLTVFEQLYTMDLSIPEIEMPVMKINENDELTQSIYTPEHNHHAAIIFFAQIAHVLPELAPHLEETATKEKITRALEFIKKNIVSGMNTDEISLLSSRKKSENLVNNATFALFAFIADLQNSIDLFNITTKINNTLITAADDLGYYTLVEKILSTFFGSQQVPIIEKLIEFNLEKTLKANPALWNIQTLTVKPPLHIAISKNNAKITQILLENGAPIDIQDNQGNTPLHIAVSNHYIEIAQLLLEKQANPNIQNSLGYTPLYIAIAAENLSMTQLLLENNATADINPQHIYRLLAHAVDDNIQLAQLIIKKSKNLNIPISTLVSFAIVNDNFKTTEFLFQNGADVNAPDIYSYTPLHRAAQDGNIQIMQFLLKIGADVNAPDINSYTHLHRAAQDGNIQIMQFLLKIGADINIQNKYGDTPLHNAIYKKQKEAATLLIQHHADTTIKNEDGETPEELANKYKIDLNIE